MNKEFQWTDALVKEMIWSKLPVPEHYFGNVQKCLDEFKASHTPEVKRDNDWQIIDFTVHGLTWCFYPKEKKYYNDLGSFYEVVPKTAIIHSVRRLSDNEVFSVGDEVDSTWGKQKIVDFEIQSDGDMVVGFETCRNPLVKISKLPQRTKLFTTEDGVDLFEGDIYWTVEPNRDCLMYFSGATGFGSGEKEERKYFSNEEKAKEYVTLNKPCLSVNDVLALDLDISVVKNSDVQLPPHRLKKEKCIIVFPEKLKELAKSKTNK